ncbi:hypothetical protein F2Q69_00006947 [Brassica cretica]|uniref:DUF1204 domain-containing protein n=2 Tax=Brassica TaxID=3705 RepID=A0A8S9P4F9_BRACR|nr:hypothetical protein F2Q69_00006947 [Brassica cretica]
MMWAFWEGQVHTQHTQPASVPDPVDVEPSSEDSAPESDEPAKAKKKGKKRSAPGPSVVATQEGSSEAATDVRLDEPPKKKKKKEKELKNSVEEEPELGEGIEDREVVAHGGSGHGIVAQTDDGLSGSPVVPLEKNRRKASIEQDAPASSEQDHSKFVDESAVEKDQQLEEKTTQKVKFLEKFGELNDKFKSSLEKNKGLEREKAVLENEKPALKEEQKTASLRHVREINRLKDFWNFKVTHERVKVQTTMIVKCNRRFNHIRSREARREDFDNARLLYSQAFGTRKCLESLKANGRDIPQEVI